MVFKTDWEYNIIPRELTEIKKIPFKIKPKYFICCNPPSMVNVNYSPKESKKIEEKIKEAYFKK